jgi:thiamine-phosphate pyrophosphorylase
VRLPEPPLLVITDRSQAHRPLEEVAAAAFAGGCRWLSLREKDLAAAARLDLLRRLIEAARPYGAIIGIHDDVEAAAITGCGAVHLPDGAPIAAARARLGTRVLIGASAHDAAGLAAAAEAGADYATLSPVFDSASKPGYGPVLGLDAFAAAARQATLPLLALGGIDARLVGGVVAAGAAGVAVMGEAMRAADPERAVKALVGALAAARSRHHSPPR